MEASPDYSFLYEMLRVHINKDMHFTKDIDEEFIKVMGGARYNRKVSDLLNRREYRIRCGGLDIVFLFYNDKTHNIALSNPSQNEIVPLKDKNKPRTEADFLDLFIGLGG